MFGNYISVYDIQRAVEDGATVPIYYESRLAKLALDESARPNIDLDFEEATEGEEVERKERLKTRWAQLEAIVGTEERLRLVAEDIVAHFDDRTEAMEGKAMVVCMSRRTSATSRAAKPWRSASAIQATPFTLSWYATCGSPASMRRACTPCTWTSPCVGTD